jgi:protein-tyrosine phosphatase
MTSSGQSTSAVLGHLRDAGRRAGLGRAKRLVEESVSRLVHPFHRQRALRRLRRAGRIDAVLFVCQGNIYRSPYAEQLFLKLLPAGLAGQFRVSSAGFVGPGRACPEPAITLANSRGVELGYHRSSSIHPDRIDARTLVVVMEPHQHTAVRAISAAGVVVLLGDLDPEPVSSRAIQDPWSETEDVLRKSYDRVERCVRVLIDLLSGQAHAP